MEPLGTSLRAVKLGARVQLRVIGALILREMQTRYGRENIGYLWAVIEPLILLTMFVTLFMYHGKTAHAGLNLVSFLATGIMTFVSLRKIVTSIAAATDANKNLLLYPQVTPIDTMLARVVLEGATYIVVFAVIIFGGYFFGLATLPYDWMGVITGLLAVILLGVALGLLQDVILTLLPTASKVMGPLWRLLFFTSCVFYSLNDLPLGLRDIVMLNPICHVIELLRKSFFLSFNTPVESYDYVILWSLLSIFLGLLIERLYRRKEAAL